MVARISSEISPRAAHLLTPYRSATRFQVTVDFLLQQVTFLTERHASQVRAQMRKAAAAAKGSSAASPIPGSDSAQGLGVAAGGGEPMRRAGSGGGVGGGGVGGAVASRAPSALSVRRDSPLPGGRGEGSGSGTPTRATGRPGVSTNPSTSTPPTHSVLLPKGPVLKATAERRRLSSLPISSGAVTPRPEPESEQRTTQPGGPDDAASPGPADDEETSSDTASSKSSPAQSRLVRRPPRFSGGQQPQDGAASLADEEESEEAEPAFLPFKSPTTAGRGVDSSAQDVGATLRLSKGKGKETAKQQQQQQQQSQTSDSSTSSAPLKRERTAVDRRPRGPPGPLSPRRTAELAGRSPGAKGKGYSREGSDGTPSMGSSFSDLDGQSHPVPKPSLVFLC
jgi:hypothetical protein